MRQVVGSDNQSVRMEEAGRNGWRAWFAISPGAIALSLAFLGMVAAGRGLSARPARAAQSSAGNQTLPSLPREFGVKPILTLVGRETIVRIGVSNGQRFYSVFDRSGFPLATRMTKQELARAFPRLKLESMTDIASGLSIESRLLADTPSE